MKWIRSDQGFRSAWLFLGLAYSVLASLGPLLRRTPLDALEPFINGSVLAIVGLVLFVPRQLLRSILLMGLVALTVMYVAERQLARYAWMPTFTQLQLLPNLHDFGNHFSLAADDSNATRKYRTWQVPAGTSAVRLTGTLASLQGEAGWWWHSFENSAHLSRSAERPGITIFQPESPQTYLYRRHDTLAEIGGRHFRATVELSATAAPTCGLLYLGTPSGEYRTSTEVCPNAQLKAYALYWLAPEEASETALDLILNNFEGPSLEIGTATLEEYVGDAWESLGAMAPTGVAVYLTASPRAPWTKPPVESSLVALSQEEVGTTFTFEAPLADLGKSDKLWVIVEAEPGVSAVVTGVSLSGVNGTELRPVAPVAITRQAWPFHHPNLAGHAFVVAALAVASLSNSRAVIALALGLGLLLAVLTGSRSALIAGLSWIALALALPPLRNVFTRQRAVAVGSVIAVMLIMTTAPILLSQRSFERFSIWRSLLDSIGPHLLIGQGVEGTLVDSAGQFVSHAHNLWLQGLWQGGLFGLLATLLLTAGLLFQAHRTASLKILAFAVAALVLQVVDYTLFYVPLLALVVGTINSAFAAHKTDDRGSESLEAA